MKAIPKTVHYCWFGGGDKPELIKKCMKSWKERLPDYNIIKWNEKNFNVETSDFTKKAYKMKKWAFVADYCRLWVLYKNGGIYLDTDVEVIKNMDYLLHQTAFIGIESDVEINAAIWGCKKNDPFVKKILDYYNTLNYDDFKEDLSKLAIPKIITQIAKEQGYLLCNKIQKLENGTVIYPKEYFYPKNQSWEKPIISVNTYTIHHYEGSWRSPLQIYRSKFKQVLINIFGYDIVVKLVNLLKLNFKNKNKKKVML